MAKATWLGLDTPYARLQKIEKLDPERDSREIVALFYRDFQSIMLLPAFTGYMLANAAPRQSRILGATGELEFRTAKRFVDTAVLGSTILEHGIKKPGPGREAAKRVNGMHTHYKIHPDDFVAFSCAQVVSAISTAESFGWRRVTNIEREAIRVHYAEETRILGGLTPIPPTLPEIYAWWERYMDTQMAFEPQNLRMTRAMLDFMKSIMPLPLRPWIADLLMAQIDPRITVNCGVKVPGPGTRRASDALFRLVGMRDPLPDNAPDLFSILVKKVYPNGYTLSKMGTQHGAKDNLGLYKESSNVA